MQEPNLSGFSFADWSSFAASAVGSARTTDERRFEAFVRRIRFELNRLAFRQTSETFHLYDRLYINNKYH